MKTYVIHMSSSTARQSNAELLRQSLPNAELVEAVNGSDPTQINQIDTLRGTLHRPHYPFALKPGEIGCFLSHRKCWEKIADGPEDYALISEDDLHLDQKLWPHAQNLISIHAGTDSFVRLPAKAREKPVHIQDADNAVRLFVPRVIGLQTVLQVVGREAAKRLLTASEVIDRPVDTFLQMHWVTGQRIQTILPNGVSEITGEIGGSTIQKKTRASSKLSREWKRILYRAQVNRRPQMV